VAPRFSATKEALSRSGALAPEVYALDLELKDKVILITGGAKGIGAAISRAAAAEGAIPVVVDKAVAAGNELCSHLPGSELVIAELSSPESCCAAVDHTTRKFSRLDALVNNAGVNDRIGLEHGSPQKYVESLQRNLLHYYNMAHFALPHLKKSRGSIVNIASKTALTGQGGTSGYASAKGAILALTREWAAELADYGIRVNAIVPAEVMTPLYRQWLDTFPQPEDKLKSILAKIPLQKRMTTPEEIAAMVVFLLSARAAHITAQYIFVDGGYVHLDRALT
jgi:L-fucose dehydrogenase